MEKIKAVFTNFSDTASRQNLDFFLSYFALDLVYP